MDININALHAAVASICPITGVGVGDPTDKTTWRVDFDPSATDDQKRAAEAAVQSYIDVPISPVIDYLQFEALFTQAESDAIMGAAAGGNASLLRWLLRASGARRIDLGNPEVKAGIEALVKAGLVASGREVQILAGTPPS